MNSMSPTPSPRLPSRRPVWPVALPVLIAALTSAVSIFAVWHEIERRHRERGLERLAFDARETTLRVEQRMRAYRQVLRGGRALFNASDEVTAEDWKAYVESLALQEDFPGIQGVGFSQYVSADDLDAHIAGMVARGHKDYGIHPPGARAEYSSIIYLEPFNWRNRRAFYYDMFSEPVRREAMERARRTGEAALSGKVRLVQEADQDIQSGVLLYLPAYRRGSPTDTVEQRTSALLGWVYSPFRMRDLMLGTLGPASDTLRMRIYDGDRAHPENRLFDSHEGEPLHIGALSQSVSRNIDGRNWLLVFEIHGDSDADLNRWRTELAIVAIFGVLVVALTASLTLARRRAARLTVLSESLARSESMYSTLVNLSGESILSLDRNGRIEYANPGLYRTLNLEAGALTGERLERLGDDKGRHALQSMSNALLGGETVRMELLLRSRGRNDVTVLASGVPRTNATGQITGAIVVMADISERKADEARIAWLATHDSLTGLPNRSLFADRLNRALNAEQRYSRSFCVLFIDLDRFKEVNDRMGHHAGDTLLIEASRRMLSCVRSADTLARQGGDEFVALLPETGTLDGALAVAEKIRAQLQEPFELDEGRAQISASIGIVMCPEHGTDFDTLVGRADEAMYSAKNEGRNTITVWPPPDDKKESPQ